MLSNAFPVTAPKAPPPAPGIAPAIAPATATPRICIIPDSVLYNILVLPLSS